MKIGKYFFSFLAIVLVIGLMTVINKNASQYTTQNAAITLIPSTIKETIQQGFKEGKVEVLFPHFDELISICMDDVEEIYLAYNAKTALQNFFTTHPPAEFEINHSGKNKSGLKAYYIGDYEDTQQEKFRVYILTEKELIQEIEISKKDIAS